MKVTITERKPKLSHGSQPCITAMSTAGPSKMDGSWWRVLIKHGPLEKGMANHQVFFPQEPSELYEKAQKYDTGR